MVKRMRFAFMILILVLASCGSISYKYYSLVPDDDGLLNGHLIADEPKNDTNLETLCRDPNNNQMVKCLVITVDEFFRLKEDLEITKKQLEECERQLP